MTEAAGTSETPVHASLQSVTPHKTLSSDRNESNDSKL